ncbi:MAG: hypothetical protein R6U98_12695, partial [Pirellulaceae bacterium]
QRVYLFAATYVNVPPFTRSQLFSQLTQGSSRRRGFEDSPAERGGRRPLQSSKMDSDMPPSGLWPYG